MTISAAARLLGQAQKIACLTGAGVSAESGVATFRDPQTGHWARFDPQQLASQDGFAADPGLVWRWYMERLLGVTQRAQPNAGHRALAEIEQMRPHFTLITQNVDNLHERGGSQCVIHLHGEITRFHCNRCGRTYDLNEAEQAAAEPPHCINCGGLVRPSVVWFGENLPLSAMNAAWQAAESCDLMLVVGTSGVVYPAAQLPFVAQERGAVVIDINPEPSPISEMATLYLPGPSGVILPQIISQMQEAGLGE